MAERRFFILEKEIDQNLVNITGSEYHYAVHVLRLTAGDEITLIGQSYKFKATVKTITKTKLVAEIKAKSLLTFSPIKLELFQGLPKATKMDMIVEKSTELGVDVIYPLLTERTVVSLNAAARAKKINRWQKIAREATRQSNRSTIPRVEPPLEFNQAIKLLTNYNLIIVFWEKATARLDASLFINLKKGRVAVFIGPEGGFSEAEINCLKSNGAFIASLGPRILRTETASLAALAIIGWLFNEFN